MAYLRYEALAWYRKAATQGDVVAHYNLGVMYDNGYGVAQDHGEAARWYEQAVARNYGPAMYNLALQHEYGMSRPKDYAAAKDLYIQAAELGEPWAQFALALLYDNGLGVFAKDMKWEGTISGKVGTKPYSGDFKQK